MNLFELFCKIGVDDQASGKLKDISGKLGSGLKTAAKIGTAAVSAAAAGITALTTAAVNNYAEYEQLVGGVETLFKDSADKVQEYAANAYKTAGMSANEYMSTVTSFSAALLRSVGGDTEKAAKLADTAIEDMSDNANKMGTSLESLQNAYTGFSRGNFTMLDNLALGFSGTKEGMQELLDTAEELSGIKYDIESYADIVEAIHVVQTEMGITGTTALEAGRTISGSVGAMKSAWSNLVAGLANGNADIGTLVDNLVTTVVGDGTESNLGVLGNVMPAVKTALSGASKLVSELLPAIVQEIPAIINDNLPILAEAAIGIVQSLVDGLSSDQGSLVQTAFDTIVLIADSLISMLPQIVSLGLELIVALANGIASSVPALIPTIVDVVLQIAAMLTDGGTLSSLLDAALQIVLGLADGIVASLPFLIEKAPEIIESLVSAIIGAIPMLLGSAGEIIFTLASGIISSLPAIVSSGIDIVNSLIDGVLSYIGYFQENGAELVGAFIDGLSSLYGSLVDVGGEVVNAIKEGISAAWDGITSWFNGIWDALFGGRTVDVSVNGTGGVAVDGSHASGLSYVPYDGYIAELHKGERVLTAKENESYGNSFSMGDIVINVDGGNYDERQLAERIAEEIQSMTDRRAAVYA